ncbi:restriction endonuclease subunit S [Persephonella sp.]
MLKNKDVEKEKLRLLSIPSNLIFNDAELRLNANSYSFEYLQAVSIVEKLKRKGIFVDKLGNLAENIFYPSRFKRKYVKKGIPFLSSIEIFKFDIKANKYIQNPPVNSFVDKNWILITRSGSIGRTIISNELFRDFSVSEHVIRYIPQKDEKFGYIYAYLNTFIGQSILKKSKFGAVVDQIEPHHVADLPIPRLPEIEEEINNLILKAHKLREEAQRKLLEAEKLFYKELNLPKIDEDSVEYYGGEKGKEVKAFTIKASELNDRLDASYHIPLAHKVEKILENNIKGKVKLLDEVSHSFVPPRFKRFYVNNKEEGVPLIQGKYIPLVKLLDIKYIWKNMKNIEKYEIKKGWILITRSGTIGQLTLVSKLWEGFLGSDHLIRIIPQNINSGYLTMFLLSDYGQIQFQRLTYGGVVDEIGEAGDLFKFIKILKPKDKNLEDKIGSLVIDAYNKKDQANILEQQAIERLETFFTKL